MARSPVSDGGSTDEHVLTVSTHGSWRTGAAMSLARAHTEDEGQCWGGGSPVLRRCSSEETMAQWSKMVPIDPA
jgi:hypothetical protein